MRHLNKFRLPETETNMENQNTQQNEQHHRSIKSFVLRQGHMTAAQQRAIDENWEKIGVNFQSVKDMRFLKTLHQSRACSRLSNQRFMII